MHAIPDRDDEQVRDNEMVEQYHKENSSNVDLQTVSPEQVDTIIFNLHKVNLQV